MKDDFITLKTGDDITLGSITITNIYSKLSTLWVSQQMSISIWSNVLSLPDSFNLKMIFSSKCDQAIQL